MSLSSRPWIRWSAAALLGAAIVATISPPWVRGQAGAATERPKCVGISSAIVHESNPTIVRVYRAFDDGSVEVYDNGPNPGSWTPLGK